jgi:hypothetical protein
MLTGNLKTPKFTPKTSLDQNQHPLSKKSHLSLSLINYENK